MSLTRAKDTSRDRLSSFRKGAGFLCPDEPFRESIQGFHLVGAQKDTSFGWAGAEYLTHPAQIALPDSDTSQGSTTIENHSHVNLGTCT